MSTQDQVNGYFQEYILYYCNHEQKDATFYDYINLTDVCTVGYDSNTPPQLVISGWLIGGYAAPSNALLLTYTFTNVDTYFNNFYVVPSEIKTTQPFSITTTALNNVINHSFMTGYVCLDTTAQALKFYTGSAWITSASRFLPSGAQTANLNMNTHEIDNVTTLYQSTPSCVSIWSSDNVSISFTANTPKVINITNFSQTVNPNSDFTFSSSTGQLTYTGATTRYFRVTVQYSYSALAIATTLTNYLSKNGSTSISGARTVITFLLLGQASVFNSYVSDIVQLATNDTIQLGGQLATTNSVSFQALNYCVQQV